MSELSKKVSQKAIPLNGKTYLINAYKGVKGWSYLPRLAKYVFPFISYMFNEGKEDADVVDSVMSLLSGESAEEVTKLIMDIVSDIQVDNSSIDFDFEFAQNYDTLILLVVEVIKLNYFDSFQRLVTNLPKA